MERRQEEKVCALSQKNSGFFINGLGVDGSIVSLDVIKSRTNKTGRSKCNLVFDYNNGYDADLSLFIMLKEEKLLEGAGAYLKIPGSDIKFAQRNFKQLLHTNQEFYNNFASFCMKYLTSKLLEDYESIKASENAYTGYTSPYSAILAQYNSGDPAMFDSLINKNSVVTSSDNNYDNN